MEAFAGTFVFARIGSTQVLARVWADPCWMRDLADDRTRMGVTMVMMVIIAVGEVAVATG